MSDEVRVAHLFCLHAKYVWNSLLNNISINIFIMDSHTTISYLTWHFITSNLPFFHTGDEIVTSRGVQALHWTTLLSAVPTTEALEQIICLLQIFWRKFKATNDENVRINMFTSTVWVIICIKLHSAVWCSRWKSTSDQINRKHLLKKFPLFHAIHIFIDELSIFNIKAAN